MDEKVNIRLHNAMIEVAVCEFWEKKIAETDWIKDGDHEFSEEHTARINTVIRKHKAQARRKRMMRAAKRVAIVILILFSVSFVTLMSSAAVRAEVYRITSAFREVFSKLVTGEITAEEAVDLNADIQIKQLESILSEQLALTGMPGDTTFQIHIDGNLNLSIIGLDEIDPKDALPFLKDAVFSTAIADTLSSAYASQSKNQIYYIQSVIRTSDAFASDQSDDLKPIKAEYRQIIRDYMLANNLKDRDEIMNQPRIISFVDGKLIFEEN